MRLKELKKRYDFLLKFSEFLAHKLRSHGLENHLKFLLPSENQSSHLLDNPDYLKNLVDNVIFKVLMIHAKTQSTV